MCVYIVYCALLPPPVFPTWVSQSLCGGPVFAGEGRLREGEREREECVRKGGAKKALVLLSITGGERVRQGTRNGRLSDQLAWR